MRSPDRWQILVSEPFYEMLSAKTRGGFSRTEPMEFKHVSQAVANYCYTVPAEGTAAMQPV